MKKELLEKYRAKGKGHYEVSANIDGKVLSAVTTNTLAIDAAYDDCYDDLDNSDNFFESRQEAIDELIEEIIRKNK